MLHLLLTDTLLPAEMIAAQDGVRIETRLDSLDDIDNSDEEDGSDSSDSEADDEDC